MDSATWRSKFSSQASGKMESRSTQDLAGKPRLVETLVMLVLQLSRMGIPDEVILEKVRKITSNN